MSAQEGCWTRRYKTKLFQHSSFIMNNPRTVLIVGESTTFMTDIELVQ